MNKNWIVFQNQKIAIPNKTILNKVLKENKFQLKYFKENNKEGLFSKLKKRFKKCEEN